MMTSCAPMPFILSNMPSAWRFEIAFDAQRGKFVGHDAHRPAGRVALRWRPAVGIGTIGLNFRRRLAFVAVAEGAEAALDLHAFADEIGGALGAVGGDDDPAADDRVFS